MQHRALIESWFRRVWEDEDLDAIVEFMTPHPKVTGLSKAPLAGPDEFRGFAAAMLAHMQDTKISIDHYMEQGDWASFLMHVSATHRGSGTPISFSGLGMVRVEDGKSAETYNFADFFNFFEQIGKLPDNSLECCLVGEGLCDTPGRH